MSNHFKFCGGCGHRAPFCTCAEFVDSRPASHNTSHNTPSQPFDLRAANSMQDNNAPGETRTPNLLIRSQSRLGYSGLRKSTLEWEGASGSPTQQQETPTGSHNRSHNTSAHDLVNAVVRVLDEVAASTVGVGSSRARALELLP